MIVNGDSIKITGQFSIGCKKVRLGERIYNHGSSRQSDCRFQLNWSRLANGRMAAAGADQALALISTATILVSVTAGGNRVGK